MGALVDELTVKSADFTRLWAMQEVGEKGRRLKRLSHPVVGDLNLEFEALTLPEPGPRRLVVYLPADEAGAAALDRLAPAASPAIGRLRAVPGGA